MAYGSGRKEDERYCYFCMAILPTKIVDDIDEYGHVQSCLIKRICIKCSQEIKPPEEVKENDN